MTAAEILRGKLRNVRASKYGGDYADCPGRHPAGRGLLSAGPGGVPVWRCDAGCGSDDLATALEHQRRTGLDLNVKAERPTGAVVVAAFERLARRAIIVYPRGRVLVLRCSCGLGRVYLFDDLDVGACRSCSIAPVEVADLLGVARRWFSPTARAVSVARLALREIAEGARPRRSRRRALSRFFSALGELPYLTPRELIEWRTPSEVVHGA